MCHTAGIAAELAERLFATTMALTDLRHSLLNACYSKLSKTFCTATISNLRVFLTLYQFLLKVVSNMLGELVAAGSAYTVLLDEWLCTGTEL